MISEATVLGGPVFLFAAGWRSGSTMVQRLLTSSGKLLIWGEAGGAIGCLAEAAERLRQMLAPGSELHRFGYGGDGASQYETFLRTPMRERAARWMACMNASEPTLNDALRAFLEHFYARPAAGLGYPRWGLKEVQSGAADVRFLASLYPAARFVLLIRHPLHCVLSAKRRAWIDRRSERRPARFFASHWVRLAREFRQLGTGRIVYYERLLEHESERGALAQYLALPPFPPAFLSRNFADWPAVTDEQLSWRERRDVLAIAGQEMAQHGYSA